MANEQNRTNVQFLLVDVDYNIPYDQQPECKRHVIGAYANLARHNMTLTVNTIMQAIGMGTFNENSIGDAFGKSHRLEIAQLDNVKKLTLQKRLYRHFPFFKRLKLEDEKKKSVQLITLLEIMSDFTDYMALLRNTYTHYNPYITPDKAIVYQELRKRVGKLLDQLFENSSRIYKKGEKLPHENNEIFATQRKLTPHEKDILMNRDEEFSEILTQVQDEIKKRKEEYAEAVKKQQEDLKKGIKPTKELKPVSETEVKIGKDTFIIGSDGKSIRKKWNQYDRDPQYYARMCDARNGISDAGIIYFLCLFLDKQVAIDFMDEVGFTEQCDFSEGNIVFLKELMCMNRIRMVKMRLDSEMDETALALDMMSELRKCPQPLYDVLDKSARDEFKDDSTVKWEMEHQQEATIADSQKEESAEQEAMPIKDTPRSTLVRWEDRFPELALQYIDRQCLFTDIRFQLRLGKYRFAFYNHNTNQSIDGIERLRILQKEMHGFGRIQEVKEIIKDKWKNYFDKKEVEDGLTKKSPDVAGQAPYITEQRPQYDIDEKSHSIGLRWDGWDNENRKTVKDNNGRERKEPHYGDLNPKKMFIPYLPNFQATEGDLHQKNTAETLLPPQCMLSLYDLPALLFHRYLLDKYGKDKSQTEQIIKDYYNNLCDFFSDVSKGVYKPLTDYHLNSADIPEKIRKHLFGINTDNFERLKKAASRRLQERKERIQRTQQKYNEKKDRIGGKDNKFDKLRATIKTGQLGQWLMRDIMDWIPQNSQARKKLTGQNYVVLQSCITMLGQSFNEDGNIINVTLSKLENMMQNARMIAKDGEKNDAFIFHPFLHLVFSQCYGESVEAFYEKYLEKELNWINTMIDDINKSRKEDATISRYRLIPFLHHNRTRWQKVDENTVKSLASRYLERPIQLPNGLFTEKIRLLLAEIARENNYTELSAELSKAENAAHLINLYHTLAEKDDSQRFYHNEPSKIGTIKTPNAYGHLYRLFKKIYGEKNEATNHKYKFGSTEINSLFTKKKDVLTSTMQRLSIKTIDYKIYEYIIKEMGKEKVLKPVDIHLFILDWKYDELTEEEYEKVTTPDEREAIKRLLPDILRKIKKYEENIILDYYKKMRRMVTKVQDNERAIRRFKTQDILLLYMARNILKAKSNNEEDFTTDFLLKNVCQGDNLLDKTIDFEWIVNIKEKTNESEEPKLIEKKIKQEKMKMKNYGQFYKFASDHQRLESLLSRLPDTIFQRAEIENEFAYYDTNRSEVFRQVYIIESEAYKLKPELLNDTNATEDWFWYIEPRSNKRRARRNNFMNLLETLAAGKDGILDEVEKRTLQSTRNAFGHNTYDVDMSVIFEGKEDKKKIPEIANGIKSKIDEQTKELKENLEN
jgi:hypothetical protein